LIRYGDEEQNVRDCDTETGDREEPMGMGKGLPVAVNVSYAEDYIKEGVYHTEADGVHHFLQ